MYLKIVVNKSDFWKAININMLKIINFLENYKKLWLINHIIAKNTIFWGKNLFDNCG